VALVLAGLVAVAGGAVLTALLWPVDPPPPPPRVTEGEHLRYAVSFMGVEAGTLDLVKTDDADAPGVSIVEMRLTSTNKLLESVFRVREHWRSRVNRDEIFSLGYELSRRHGSRELADEQDHDYPARQSRWRRVAGEQEWEGVIPLDGPVQDPVSWVYHCRERLMKGERELSFIIVERDRVRRAKLAVTGEEEIDLGPLGSVRALRASGSVGFGSLGGAEPKDSGGTEDATDAGSAKEARVDQKASIVWFDAATGIIVKARIAAKVGSMELVLRDGGSALPVGPAPR
jgi:hypothetical protein